MNEKEKRATLTTVARINNVGIVLVHDKNEVRVPVRPICDAIGVAYQSQIEKLKNDPFFSSTVMLSVTVGADGKDREMVTIPFRFVFGWLCRIDSRNVKPEAQDAVLRYQKECYHVLYEHFSLMDEFLRRQSEAFSAYLSEYDLARSNFKNAEKLMKEARQKLDDVRYVTFDQWKSDRSQLQLFTAEEQEGQPS